MAKNTEVPQAVDMMQALRMMTQGPGPLGLLAPQIGAAWKTQATMMAEWERYADAWFDRRRAAAEEAQRCMETLQKNGAADGDAIGAISTWMSDEMTRLSADAKENVEFGMRCADLLAQNADVTGQKVADETQATADETAKATKPGTKTAPG